ncbi:hypothetical protein BZA77DRAFT_313377 [Pyronema omphalodes]|nr:hypothetical protein BZA77DRAFT_313377 [Pyronema omphalodes]
MVVEVSLSLLEILKICFLTYLAYLLVHAVGGRMDSCRGELWSCGVGELEAGERMGRGEGIRGYCIFLFFLVFCFSVSISFYCFTFLFPFPCFTPFTKITPFTKN